MGSAHDDGLYYGQEARRAGGSLANDILMLRAENERLRAALSQIIAVCDDNAAPSCEHSMALEFVRQVAANRRKI